MSEQWTVQFEENGGYDGLYGAYWIYDSKDTPLFCIDLRESCECEPHPEAERIARLAAAAPDMLKMVHKLLGIIDRDSPFVTVPACHAVEEIRTQIEKIEKGE